MHTTTEQNQNHELGWVDSSSICAEIEKTLLLLVNRVVDSRLREMKENGEIVALLRQADYSNPHYQLVDEQ